VTVLKKVRIYGKWLLLLILLTIPVLFITPAVAKTVSKEDQEKYITENKEAIENGEHPKGIDKKVYRQIAYDNFSFILSGGLDSDMSSALSLTDVDSAIREGITGIYTATKSVGIAILVIFFILELMDKISHQGFEFEYLVRLLIRYFLAKTLMDSGDDIILCLYDIGQGLIGSNTGSMSESQTQALGNMAVWLCNNNWISCWVACFFSFIPYLFAKVLGIIIWALIYGRGIDIMVRGGFAPIGCASMVQEGFTGHGLRYVKKFFSSCIQGVVMACILYAASVISSSAVSAGGISGFMDLIAICFTSLIVTFTSLMAMMKAGSIADDIAMV
jgi:hypothetical protein